MIKEALLAKIVLEFADGDREVYTTNPETWKYFGDGPYRYSGFFLGEQYDARKKAVYDAFSLADFDDSGWSAAAKEPGSFRSSQKTGLSRLVLAEAGPRYTAAKFLSKAAIRRRFM